MTAARDDAQDAAERIAPPPWSAAARGRDKQRADKPALNREAIVAAALRIIDTEGLDALSMRRVAQEFETGPASLYAHVANKDELLDLVVDAVMGECVDGWSAADANRENWQDVLKEALRHAGRVMVGHRDLAKAFVDRLPFGPNGLRAMEGVLQVLRAGGVADEIAAFSGDLIGQYLTGYAIEEYAWQTRFPGDGPQDVAMRMKQTADYLASLPASLFPNVVRLSRLIVAGEDQGVDRFELGLDVLVRGIAAFADTAAKGGAD